MSRNKFQSRSKKLNKMTRDGLVERNAVTGEETHITKQSRDFDLRKEQSAAPENFRDVKGAKPKKTNKQPLPVQATVQNTASSEQTKSTDYEGFSDESIKIEHPSDLPFEAAKPTERSYEAISHEVPAGGSPIVGASSVSKTKINKGVSGHKSLKDKKRLNFSEDKSVPKKQKRQKGNKYAEKFKPKEENSSEIQSEVQSGVQPETQSVSGSVKAYKPEPNDKPLKTKFGSKDEKSSRLKFDKNDKEDLTEQPKTKKQQFKTADVSVVTETEADTPSSDEEAIDTASDIKVEKPSRLQFSEDEKPITSTNAVKPGKKLSKIQKKADKIDTKLEKARGKLPTRKKRVKLQPDEQRANPKDKYKFEKEVIPLGEKPPLLVRAGKKVVSKATQTVVGKFHQKMTEVEDSNVAIKAFNKIEQGATNLYYTSRRGRSVFKFIKERKYRKVAKLEKKAVKAKIKLDYRRALAENPKLKSNIFSRMAQKRKIKKQYAKMAREAKRAKKIVQKTGTLTYKATKAIAGAVAKHPVVAGIIVLVVLLFFVFSSMFSSLSVVGGGSFSAIIGSSYIADDVDIDKAELIYTEWETDLQMKIASIEADRPGYDEYRYNIGNIGHSPYELMAYLTAVYEDFSYDSIEDILAARFSEQYSLTFTEALETKYRENEKGEQESYTWKVLDVTLTARSFTDVAFSQMDSDQREMYSLYMQTKGNRQYIESPFDFNWLPYVTSYYGYRVHPTSGEKNYHKGVDIGIPTGTDILSGIDGVVTASAYDTGYGYYISIKDDKGVEAKYAHCSSLLFGVGQTVKKGDIIAKSGNSGNSTGAHLHLEVLKDGIYLNPMYFAETNDDGSEPTYGDAGSAMGDGSYAALIAEAEKYLGYKYVFGGSSPSTSFDCSGFVCWVYTHSGVYNLSRTTAQGIYNQCTPVSPSEAKPGDLIFFQGTYSCPDKVTHIGIYVGNGRMLHCGDPIQYVSTTGSYWASKFYAYGRLPN